MNMKKEDIKPLDENGLKHGVWFRYWENGNLWYKVNYYHGKRHGIHESYYSDGNLMYKVNFKMHKHYGLSIGYFNSKNNEIKYKKFYL